MMHMIRHSVFVSLYAAILLVSGCSTFNVRHLAPHPWSEQKITYQNMKFWNFEYICSHEQNRYQITGNAHPCSDRLPVWGKWLSELQLTVYLCDLNGKVLASRTMRIPPGFFSRDQSIPFGFDVPDLRVSFPVSVTFGYRMILLPCCPSPKQKNYQKTKDVHVFFANQGALRQ
jgi:hypothetical protein